MSHPLLPGVLELVQQAGEAILPFWRQGVEAVSYTHLTLPTICSV